MTMDPAAFRLAIPLALLLVAGCAGPDSPPSSSSPSLGPAADAAMSESTYSGGFVEAVSLALPDGTTTTNFSPDGEPAFTLFDRAVRIHATLAWPEPPGLQAWKFCLHAPEGFSEETHCVEGRASPLELVLDEAAGIDVAGGQYLVEAVASGDGLPAGASASQDLRWTAVVTSPA